MIKVEETMATLGLCSAPAACSHGYFAVKIALGAMGQLMPNPCKATAAPHKF